MVPSYSAVYTRLSSYLKAAHSVSGESAKRRKGGGIGTRCELRPTAEQQALVAGWL